MINFNLKPMKISVNNCIVFILSLLFFGCAMAQKETPQAVQDAFEKKYPGENDPDWHKDSNGNFESHFKQDGESYRADFNPDGQWIETERSIKKDDLPKAVKNTIDKNYKELEITEIEEVYHHKKGKFYDVEFKQKGKNKDVEVDEKGRIIN